MDNDYIIGVPFKTSASEKPPTLEAFFSPAYAR